MRHLLLTAVTAVQLDKLIRSSLDVECMASTFWTDCKILLVDISSEQKGFQVYVAYRVSEIRRYTSIDQWRHINGDNNPTYVASRGVMVFMMSYSCGSKGLSFCLSLCVTRPLVMTSFSKSLSIMTRNYILRHATSALVFIPWHVSTRQRRYQCMCTLWMLYWIIIPVIIKREKRSVGCDVFCHSWETDMWQINP